ncbi:unnamed protein product [Prorocentrum cordatum]|uniref:Uncharacterized protein n=1 Tax=Prorocentrum cordatum TaxID=2364126 RepID=A0ABN9W620_9DINO|nr:unnamed protein product [Polarella glacialis]
MGALPVSPAWLDEVSEACERVVVWPSRREEDGEVVGSHLYWVLSPDGDLWEELLSGASPADGPSGSERLVAGAAPPAGDRKLYGFRERLTLNRLVELAEECRAAMEARGQTLAEAPASIELPSDVLLDISEVFPWAPPPRAPALPAHPLAGGGAGDALAAAPAGAPAPPPEGHVWALAEPAPGLPIGSIVDATTETPIGVGIDALWHRRGRAWRVEQMPEAEVADWTSRRVEKLRRLLEMVPPAAAPGDGPLALGAGPAPGGEVPPPGPGDRHAGADAGDGGPSPEERSGDDTRTLWVEWDEQGERFKEFRKAINESVSHDWGHQRLEGGLTCLHTCKMMYRTSGPPRAWLEKFLRALEEAGCFDQLNLGGLACLEVVARRLNAIVDAYKRGGAPSFANAKYLTPLGEADELPAPASRQRVSRRAEEDWEVEQSMKKAEAVDSRITSGAAARGATSSGGAAGAGGGDAKGRRQPSESCSGGQSVYEMDVAPRNLVPSKVSLPESALECRFLEDIASPGCRSFLEGDQKRMRLEPEAVDFDSMPRVYMDPVLKRNSKCYRAFVRDLARRGLLGVTSRPAESVGVVFAAKSSGALRLIIDARRSNGHFREGRRLLNAFTVCVTTTDVKDCFYRMRIHEDLGRYFCLPAAPWHVLEGLPVAGLPAEAASDAMVYPCLGALPMGFAWILHLAQAANEDRVCRSVSLQEAAPAGREQPLMQDQAEACALRASARGEGGARVYVDNLGAVSGDVALSDRMVSEWSDLFEPVGLAPHMSKSHDSWGGALGTELDGRHLRSTMTSARFWKLERGLTGLLSRSHDLKLLVQIRRFNACALAFGIAPYFRPGAVPAACPKALPAAKARARTLEKLGPPPPRVRSVRARLETSSAMPPLPASPTLADLAPEVSAGAGAAEGEGELDTSGSDSVVNQASAAPRRSRVLQDSRRRRRAALYADLIMQSNLEGSTLLERLAVTRRTRGRYAEYLDRFYLHAGLADEKLAQAKDENVDCLLCDYFTAMHLVGEQSSLGGQTGAALLGRHPAFGRRGGRSLPRTWRALKAWRRLAPSRTCRALPLAVWAAVMWRLVDKGLALMALFLAVGLSAYSRPSSLLAARKCDLAPPSRAAVDSWSLHARPDEEGRPSKTNRYDEGCLLDSSYLRAAGGTEKLWPFNYLELSEAVSLAAAAEVGAGKIILYQLRHSGAGVDVGRRARTFEEVRRCGCWAQARSMHRHEHSSRLSAEYERYPPDQRRLRESCEAHLMQIMLGLAHPVRFRQEMLAWQAEIERMAVTMVAESAIVVEKVVMPRMDMESEVIVNAVRSVPGPNFFFRLIVWSYGWLDAGLTVFAGERWVRFEVGVYVLGSFYLGAMGICFLVLLLDHLARPFFWFYRRLRRSPTFCDFCTRVEDNRRFPLDLDWRGPDAQPVDDDIVRGRSDQPPRLPNHLVAEVGGQRVRLDRGQHGDPIRKEKRAGQDFPHARVHDCTDPDLRRRLEGADTKVVHLCRAGPVGGCPSVDAFAMHFRKYTAVDAKAILELTEDRGLGSPFLAGFRTLWRAFWGGVQRIAHSFLARGAPMACLCRYHGLEYHNLRLSRIQCSEVPPNPAAAPGVPVGPDCHQLTHGVPGALVSEGTPEGDGEAPATVNGGKATPPLTIPAQAEDTVGRKYLIRLYEPADTGGGGRIARLLHAPSSKEELLRSGRGHAPGRRAGGAPAMEPNSTELGLYLQAGATGKPTGAKMLEAAAAVGRKPHRVRTAILEQVAVGPAHLGRELYLTLRGHGRGALALLEGVGWPLPLSNRIAHGLAACLMGAPKAGPADPNALTVADFVVARGAGAGPLVAAEGHRREPPSPAPADLDTWAEAAQTQIRVFALTYGQEHSLPRTTALRFLLREHQDRPEYLSLADLMEVWEELTWHWWAKMRDELRSVEAELGPHPTALPELTAYATAPDVRGRARAKIPRTFVVEDPAEYYHREGAAGGRALQPRSASAPPGGFVLNESHTCLADEEGEIRYLIPPTQEALDALNEAAARAGGDNPAPDAPLEAGRDGAGSQSTTSEEGEMLVGYLHAAQTTAGTPRRDEPGEGGWKDQPAVAEQYRNGPDFGFAENHHKAHRLNPVGDPDDPEEEAREVGMQAINARPDVREFLKGGPSRHLETAVKNHVLEENLASTATGGVLAVLRGIVDGPNWKLVREAADCLDRLAPEPGGTRGGGVRPPDRRGYARLLQAPDAGDGVGRGALQMDGGEWDMLDFHDRPPLREDPLLAERLGIQEDCERKQCVLLSAVGAALWAREGRGPPSLTEVWARALAARAEQLDQAVRAEESLGPPEAKLVVGEADLRIFIHDAVAPHHDKDYRALVAFPLRLLEDVVLNVVMTDYGGKVTTHFLEGARSGEGSPQAWMLIHRGHARALRPRTPTSGEAGGGDACLGALHQTLRREATVMNGWEEFLNRDARGTEVSWSTYVKCQACEERPAAREAALRAGRRAAAAEPARAPAIRAALQLWEELVSEHPGALGDTPAFRWGPRFKEVFAGTAGVTRAVERLGIQADEPVELYRNPLHPKALVKEADAPPGPGVANAWMFENPCTSFCDRNTKGGARTWEKPEGTGVNGKEVLGNALSQTTVRCTRNLHKWRKGWIFENQEHRGIYPKVYDLPEWLEILEETGAVIIPGTMCAWGLHPSDASSPHQFYRKGCWLVVSANLAPFFTKLRRPCPGLSPVHQHVELRDWAQELCTHCADNPKYSPEVVKEGARLGDGLVQAAGGWKEAVDCYREAWTSRWGNNLDGVFKEELCELLDPDLRDYLHQMVKGGVPARQPLAQWREALEVFCLYAGAPQAWATHFNTGLKGVLQPQERLALPGGMEELTRVGAADWSNGAYGVMDVKEVMEPVVQEEMNRLGLEEIDLKGPWREVLAGAEKGRPLVLPGDSEEGRRLAYQLVERRRARGPPAGPLARVQVFEWRATLSPYCRVAGEMGARIGATTPNPGSAVSHPWWEVHQNRLVADRAGRARTAVKETWVTCSSGSDPTGREALYFVRYALSHAATLVVLDGPLDQDLGGAREVLQEGGCDAAESRLAPLNLSSALLTPEAVPPELYMQEEEGRAHWRHFKAAGAWKSTRESEGDVRVILSPMSSGPDYPLWHPDEVSGHYPVLLEDTRGDGTPRVRRFDPKEVLLMGAARSMPPVSAHQVLWAAASAREGLLAEGARAGVCRDLDEDFMAAANATWFNAWKANPEDPRTAYEQWLREGPRRAEVQACWAEEEEEVMGTLTAAPRGRKPQTQAEPQCPLLTAEGDQPQIGGGHLADERGRLRDSLIFGNLAKGTRTSYAVAWRQRCLFLKARGGSPLLTGLGREGRRQDEDVLLDWIVHLAHVQHRSEGPIRGKLMAVRHYHIAAGYPDPLELDIADLLGQAAKPHPVGGAVSWGGGVPVEAMAGWP